MERGRADDDWEPEADDTTPDGAADDQPTAPLAHPTQLTTGIPEIDGDRPGLHVRMFGSRQFFRLWLAQLLASMADWIALLAITVLASTQILGVTLVAAAIVIPPVISRYLTRSFQALLIVSPVLGALSGAIGMYLSFYLDISSAATIVLTLAFIFISLEAGFSLRRRLREWVFTGA